MSRLLTTVQELADRGRVAEAYPMLVHAAEAGDGEACHELGLWRLSGQLIRRDLTEACTWFGRAAGAGHQEAHASYVALLANGAGGALSTWPKALAELERLAISDRTARRELDLILALDLDDAGNPHEHPAGVLISERPYVRHFPNLLSAGECAWLATRAAPLLQPAVIVDPRTGVLRTDPTRRASAAAFPFVAESPLLHAINRRIAAASDTHWAQGEPLQVLSYTRGEEFKPHSDAIGGIDNQRSLTLLAYLNENYGGGETHFLATNLKFKGRTGDAILFRNVRADGSADPDARHAGLPVRAGNKMLLSKWIRERPLDLSGPLGRPF